MGIITPGLILGLCFQVHLLPFLCSALYCRVLTLQLHFSVFLRGWGGGGGKHRRGNREQRKEGCQGVSPTGFLPWLAFPDIAVSPLWFWLPLGCGNSVLFFSHQCEGASPPPVWLFHFFITCVIKSLSYILSVINSLS